VHKLQTIELAAKGGQPLEVAHEGWVTDPVGTVVLPDYQLRVHAQLNAAGTEGDRRLHRRNRGPVFGLVIRPTPDVPRDLGKRLSILAEHKGANCRWTWVTARRPIAVRDQSHTMRGSSDRPERYLKRVIVCNDPMQYLLQELLTLQEVRLSPLRGLDGTHELLATGTALLLVLAEASTALDIDDGLFNRELLLRHLHAQLSNLCGCNAAA